MSDLLEEMKAHALEAQRFSRKHLVLELDFTEASVQLLDENCDSVEFALRGGKTPENVDMLTRIWGAYLGESLRKATKAEWFADESGGTRRLGLRGAPGATVFPHEVVRSRLTQQGAESLLAFYRDARQSLGS